MAQSPIEGVSFAPTLSRPQPHASAHVTQYYEMLGSRALYHDGWKAVVFHTAAAASPTTAATCASPFDEDEWELYHVAEDFAEVARPRGEASPTSSRELQALWWDEAERSTRCCR